MTDFSAVAPLPVRVRVLEGETPGSYAMRLAAANYSTPTDIERGLAAQGVRVEGGRTSDNYANLWRVLGNLPAAALTRPAPIAEHTVTARPLCKKCSQGDHAMGWLQDVGLVCVKHGYWIGDDAADVTAFPRVLAAERSFRKHLAERGVLHDSPTMTASGAAAVYTDSATNRPDHSASPAPGQPAVRRYPDQVAFATLITDPTFLYHVANPALPESIRRDALRTAVAEQFPSASTFEMSRACGPLWDLLRQVTKSRRAHAYGRDLAGPEIAVGISRLAPALLDDTRETRRPTSAR